MPSAPLWFAIYDRRPYQGTIPVITDISTLPWVIEVKKAFPEIKHEVLAVTGEESTLLKPHFNSKTKQAGQDWKTLPVMTWGITWPHFLRLFPALSRVIPSIPGVVSVSINKLEPGAEIEPHFGETSATIRCHMGIVVPAGLPECGLRVNGTEMAWEEGELLGFCDGYMHSAWNHTKEDRYVLLLDVVREEFMAEKNKICATCLSTYSILALGKKIPFFSFPGKLQNLITHLLTLVIRPLLVTEQQFHLIGRIRKRT